MKWWKLRRLTFVKRWQIVPTIRDQTVADHTFHCLWIAQWLRVAYGCRTDLRTLLFYTLTHDMEEAVTGDVPSPPEHKETSDWKAAWIRLIDRLEEHLFLHEEIELGNAYAARILDSNRKKGQAAIDRLNYLGIWKTEDSPPYSKVSARLFKDTHHMREDDE